MDSEAVVLIFHHFQTYNPIYFVNLRIMKLVIQRVIEASVSIGGELHSTIGQGLMVLVGVAEGDTPTMCVGLHQNVLQCVFSPTMPE